MNIEKLNSSRKKKTIVLVLVFLVVTITLILVTSMAKYKNVQSMDLASGIINYIPADIDIVSIQIENDSGNYESSTTIPTSGYMLSDESYCNVNGSKDTNVVLTYENGKVGASNISKKVKCYLYFDKLMAEKIKAQSKGEYTEFTGIATASDTGIYSAPDDYGTSYYFRGLEGSLNNWVKFANSYWRIIRVNGNGTIRMIYAGSASGLPSSSNKTGTTTQIAENYYNSNAADDNAYVGYMYGAIKSSVYDDTHTNTNDSIVKQDIDNWYKINILGTGLSEYIDNNTGFCNDRISIVGNGTGSSATSFAPFDRLHDGYPNFFTSPAYTWRTIQTPILTCQNKERDLFTHISSDIGNKKLTYSVGLITSDEVIFAGGFGGTANSTYYMYNGRYNWTMSPGFTNAAEVGVMGVFPSGGVNSLIIYNKSSIRPVLNLRADTKFTGNGSETDPFVVV